MNFIDCDADSSELKVSCATSFQGRDRPIVARHADS